MQVLGELRRRNVFKVSVAYLLLAWLLIRMANAMIGIPGSGDRIVQILTLVLILGFPIIVLFAWSCEITPTGLRPTSQIDKTQSITTETGRKLNYVLLALLALAAATLISENFA